MTKVVGVRGPPPAPRRRVKPLPAPADGSELTGLYKTKIDIMQVTETLTDGLKREYRVVVPAADLDAKVNEKLDELKGRVQLRGFRPGKVPVAHLRRVYGRAAMAETIETTIRETNAKIVSDNGYKLASEPKVTLPEEETEVEGLDIVLHAETAYETFGGSSGLRRAIPSATVAAPAAEAAPKSDAEVSA